MSSQNAYSMPVSQRSPIPSKGLLRFFYGRAEDIKDYEYSSSAFWQHLLSLVFPAPEYAVIAEQSPDNKSRRRVDVTVFFHEPENGSSAQLLLVEFKRDKTSIVDLEAQVLDAAQKQLGSTAAQVIYAMTTKGTKARVWYVHKMKPKVLVPLFGPDPGHKKSYQEIDDEDGYLILNSLAVMRGEINYDQVEPYRDWRTHFEGC